MLKVKKILLFCAITSFLFGCSVYMAAHQPDLKDTSLFKEGTPRSLLLAEYGFPTSSETKDGKKSEIFVFTQGYSKGAKAGRAFFHGAADVLTIGLWEIVGTPTEATFDGKKMAYQVTYDKDEKVDSVILLKKK